jgi:hypothetical protein
METAIIGGIVTGAFGIVWLVAFIAGLNRQDVAIVPTRPLQPGADCTSACDALRQADREVQDVRAVEQQFISERDNAATMYRNAQAAAAVALGAAIGLSLIPILGAALAVPAWAAYGVAQTLASYWLGALTNAAAALGNASGAVRRALQARSDGITQVRSRCPMAEAEACIASLSP